MPSTASRAWLRLPVLLVPPATKGASYPSTAIDILNDIPASASSLLTIVSLCRLSSAVAIKLCELARQAKSDIYVTRAIGSPDNTIRTGSNA